MIEVLEATHVAEARRYAARVGDGLGFDEAALAQIKMVASEMASNLIKHGGGGVFLAQPLPGARGAGLELLALDRGHGMQEVTRCLTDGYSTAGTLGLGLGTIVRQSGLAEIYTRPEAGTAVVAHFFRPEAARRPYGPDCGAVCVPKPGQDACGDAWGLRHEHGISWLLVTDGLGHGPLAASASQTALDAFFGWRPTRPSDGLAVLHQALRGTRGAVAGLAALEHASGSLRYAGVGNIATHLCQDDACRSVLSYDGTLGYQVRSIREHSYQIAEGGLVVMHSDGLSSRWNLTQRPGLFSAHPALVAGCLYLDYTRDTDDATVVVLRRTS